MDAQISEYSECLPKKSLRGRPTKSEIRQNIIEFLFVMKRGYGYDIYRAYKEIFPIVTMRSIYYHLKKGTDLREFKVQEIQLEKGDYSWGTEAEKTYYTLGEQASPIGDKRVEEFFSRKNSVSANSSYFSEESA